MCFQEFIIFQCGHRSLPSVLRPCPLTTAGHQFPVCSIQPLKKHCAVTMCPACERQLHTRWVLIREWEHRWLHERGVCGCDVIFPGLDRPRLIGAVKGGDSGSEGDGSGEEESKIKEEEAKDKQKTTLAGGEASTSSTNNASTKSRGKKRATFSTSVGPSNNSKIPPIYNETIAPDTGERHVEIRQPSLYAAEWVSDHAVLHRSGRCRCRADFRSFQPQVDEETGMGTEERDFLRACRDLETIKNPVLDSDEINEQMARIGVLHRDPPSQPPVVVSSSSLVTGTMNRKKMNQPAAIPPTDPPLPAPPPNPPPLDAVMRQLAVQAGMASSSYSSSSFSAAATMPPQMWTPCFDVQETQGVAAQEEASASGQAPATAHIHDNIASWAMWYPHQPHISITGYSSPHPQQQLHLPAHAHSMAQRQGPFAVTGLEPPLPEDEPSIGGNTPLPLCGLPIGAGPEGVSHMPDWHSCRLSRPRPQRRRSFS